MIIKNSLGWVTVPDQLYDAADELADFSARIRGDAQEREASRT